MEESLYQRIIEDARVIDAEGFRANVGIVICNGHGQVFWARRINQHSWQFPQGGIDDGETPEQAMYRELWEEVGLKPEQVEILYTSRHWFRYRLPKRLIRREQRPMCVGQKQKWFLLKLKCQKKMSTLYNPDTRSLMAGAGSVLVPVRQVVSFKRDVYRRVMRVPAYAMPSLNTPKTSNRHARHGRSNRRKR